MTSQLNPAWQRRPLPSDHPAKLSPPLPNSAPPPGPAVDSRRVIPFLLHDSKQEWVIRELCEVLTQRRQHCHWQSLAAAQRIDVHSTTAGHAKALCLLATTVPATFSRQRFDHVVLLVPASLAGVKAAYLDIKQLAAAHPVDIGVVMIGPRDQHAAWRYFRKLAVGALRFLDIPLLNLGFLPQQVIQGQNQPGPHRQNFLSRICERLLRSGFYSYVSTVGDTGRQAL